LIPYETPSSFGTLCNGLGVVIVSSYVKLMWGWVLTTSVLSNIYFLQE